MNGFGKSFTLILDPGHGGKDPGAIGTFSKEKNINLNVALKVGEMIKKNCPAVNVIFTRKTDVFIPLDDRAEIANKAKADLFISIHTNALPKGRDASGSETYSLGMARAKENLDVAKRENAVILYESNYQERYAGFNPNSSESYIIFDYMQDQYMKQSAELANSIQKHYARAGRPNKGVHQAGFLVLRKTSMPSVLTELGFISTPSEERYLNSAQGTDELARSIVRGFMEYYDNHDKHTRTTPQIEEEQSETSEQEQASEEKTDNNQQEVATEQNEPKQEEAQTEEVQTQEKKEKPITTEQTQKSDEKPVFKVQFLTSNRMLRNGSEQFKGLTNISHYKDKNTYKYMCGSTSNYQEILTIRKTVREKFPDCFVVAFKGEEKISVQEAQQELNKK